MLVSVGIWEVKEDVEFMWGCVETTRDVVGMTMMEGDMRVGSREM